MQVLKLKKKSTVSFFIPSESRGDQSMLSKAKVTAYAMHEFFWMNHEKYSDGEEEDESTNAHVDKKMKASKPSANSFKLSAKDAINIVLAATKYHVGPDERFEFGYDNVELATDYAHKVFEKSEELKAEYGDLFDANEIVKAFNAKTAREHEEYCEKQVIKPEMVLKDVPIGSNPDGDNGGARPGTGDTLASDKSV
jgi:hypothetical protein